MFNVLQFKVEQMIKPLSKNINDKELGKTIDKSYDETTLRWLLPEMKNKVWLG